MVREVAAAGDSARRGARLDAERDRLRPGVSLAALRLRELRPRRRQRAALGDRILSDRVLCVFWRGGWNLDRVSLGGAGANGASGTPARPPPGADCYPGHRRAAEAPS